MTSSREREETTGFYRPLVEGVAGYGLFCALGLASRFLPALFLLFVAYGILFPLIWAKKSGNWTAVGFSRQNLSTALAWGAAAGSLWAIYTYLFFGRDGALPPLWGLQIAIAVPIWLLVMSPFQEFFFRGWLQPRLEAVAGRWRGLGLTAVLFTLWHFFPQLEGTVTASLSLSTPIGVVSMLLAGLLFGYIFQRTQNIAAPWLAHALGGVALVVIGEMSFIQYVP